MTDATPAGRWGQRPLRKATKAGVGADVLIRPWTALSVSCADSSPGGGAEDGGTAGGHRGPPLRRILRDDFVGGNKIVFCLVGWRGPAHQGEHGDGGRNPSVTASPCQLPLTREPALSVSCADSSPTGGAKGRGTDRHVAALLAMKK
nr:MAG TPA: hypothetical protein [Caudoviricetes sp.]